MKTMQFENVHFEDIVLEKGDSEYYGKAKHVRISVPPALCDRALFDKNGLIMIDRSVMAQIPLVNPVKFQMWNELEIRRTNEYNLQLEQMAFDNFCDDSRFSLPADKEQKLYGAILQEYLTKLDQPFVCVYKDCPVGFIQTIIENNNPYIYLGVADYKYRLMGCGPSLYQYVVNYFQKENYRFVGGRISAKNVAVMNIYASLGAVFSAPLDVYAKKCEEAEYGEN